MRESRLPFAANLDLPLDAIAQRLALVGQSGSGKSYAAMRLAESMLTAGAQVVPVDPVGVWWGLRASADGKGQGIPINVFGGSHGDLPLRPESGALVAELVVSRDLSVVLDVSDFTNSAQHRFVADFAERFFELKKRKVGPVHLFFEEAQTFAPQVLPPSPHAGVMLDRVVRLVKVGRNYGIGTSLITQRPQAVSKEALTQAACLVAMRTLGKQERKAIDEWLGDNQVSDDAPDLDKVLRQLDTGEAWVASPHWLKVAGRYRVSKRATYDASYTPVFGASARPPQKLAPVDVESLRAAMVDVVDQAAKDDPVALRKRIAQLESDLKKAGTAPGKVDRVEVPVLLPEDLERLEKMVEQLDRQRDSLAQAQQVVTTEVGILSDQLKALRRPAVSPAPVAPRPAQPRPAKASTPSGAASGLKRGAREMLAILLSMRPRKLTRQQLATLAGFSASGGGFQTYLSTLRGAGLIEESGQELTASPAGLAAVGDIPSPQTTDELQRLWGAKLKKGAREMLDHLIGLHPKAIDRAELAKAVGMEVSGGGFQTYLSTLRSNGLIEEPDRGQVAASGVFFIGEAP